MMGNLYIMYLQIQRITDEGIKFRQLYQVESYPAIIIIDPRTGEDFVYICTVHVLVLF